LKTPFCTPNLIENIPGCLKYGSHKDSRCLAALKITSQVYLKHAGGIVAAKRITGKATSRPKHIFKNNIKSKYLGF